MSQTFRKILQLVKNKEIKISAHGYDELSNDNIYFRDIINSITEGKVIEDYPDYPKGACVLVLQRAHENQAIHVLWGIPKNTKSPAVLITAYRPDSNRWDKTFIRRKQ
ncbi:DUF4258 domain-containing protein [Cyanothece sp. BG0011]|uniref:DUF4258 domain-containing protein n=1 Tax=Cyanothece sp. BG0011 TaxID=2082950 RepID=UPI000D1E3A3A|nr:DUF4258 domain-containing protein [Cyanothece sp. BG0011]